MASKTYYTTDGEPALYSDDEGKYLYTFEGDCLYWAESGWWYEMDGGDAAFYVEGNWVYSQSGEPRYYTT